MGTNTSRSTLFDKILKTSGKGRKRSLSADLQVYLKSKNVKYEIGFQHKPKDIPTIIVSNHFVRPLFLRKSIFTTGDCILTSAIIAKAASQFSKRKITATVKNDLAANIFFINIKIRKIQIAAIDVYTLIGVSRNYPFGNFDKWCQALQAGKNIIIYPEGEISQNMKRFRQGLNNAYEYLKKYHFEFQILPCAIYYKEGKFVIIFGSAIKSNWNADKIESTVAREISSLLPKNLRGYYSENHFS